MLGSLIVRALTGVVLFLLSIPQTSSCFVIAVYIWRFRVVVLSHKSSIGLGTNHAIQHLGIKLPSTEISKSSHLAISAGRDAQFS